MEHVTSAGAGAAVTSPLWLHQLQHISDVAATILPILGAAWLVIQIVTHLLKQRRK